MAAEADPGPAGAAVVVNPTWARKPSSDDMALYYPEAAQRLGMEGVAIIECKVQVSGEVDRCVVASEDPPGYGFGLAALRMAPTFRMTPKLVNGQPVDGGTVRVPLRFVAPTESSDDQTNPLLQLLSKIDPGVARQVELGFGGLVVAVILVVFLTRLLAPNRTDRR